MIQYCLIKDEFVSKKIFNIAGEKVKLLYIGSQNKGENYVRWNAKNKFGKTVTSGIYVCTITTDSFRDSKMIVYY